MPAQLALFRGINVGKAKRIAMADLRETFEAIGFSEVRTLLNSGNVVFNAGHGTAAAHAAKIRAAVAERSGVSANVLVLGAKDLDTAIAGNPFTDRIDDPSRMLLGFFAEGVDRKLFEALKTAFPEEAFAIGTNACYLWCPNGILESRIGDALVGVKFRDMVTTRNWSTALRLQTMAAE